jgi:hexosaminidase
MPCNYMQDLPFSGTKGLNFLLLICLLFVNFPAVRAQTPLSSINQHFKLLPQPQQVEVKKGEGLAAGKLNTIVLEGKTQKPVLYGELQTLHTVKNPQKGSLILKISTDVTALHNSDEAYVLDIKNGKATVSARAQAGLFYGCQTLNQLLEDAKDQNLPIPAVTITDFPNISYRSVHLDLKHHLDSTSFYYQLIDRLAQIKVNAMIIEFEDKLKYVKAPPVGASNALSIEEFAKLSRYAKARNIEISPLVQGLGHAPFILKHPQYAQLRDDPESDWAFCALNPGTYDLQFKLYEDAIAATPHGKYLHIGGDEVGELGKSELAKKSGMKPFELQMYWLNKVTEFAKKHNRIPIFWDDMIFQLSGLYRTTYDTSLSEAESKEIWAQNQSRLDDNIKLFPKECIFMRWNYGSQNVWGNLAALDWYKSKNIPVMAATAAQTNWMLMPRHNSNIKPIQGFSQITSKKSLDGILCTTWEDGSPHSETFMRGFHFFGLYSWNPGNTSNEDANVIFRHRFYGPSISTAEFEYQDVLESALSFWETGLIDQGERDKSRRPFELITLPDRNIPGEWRKKYRDKITLARLALEKYAVVKTKIANVSALNIRNSYHLQLMNQINELQVYPASLVVLLAKFDQAPTAGKTKTLLQIRELVNEFKEKRKSFETVFSQTRILNLPDDYIMDSNKKHPHMANSKTSDWMYRFELAMNEKMESWFTNFDF